MDRKNILVVDVEENTLSFREYVLELVSHRVNAVEDSKEALKSDLVFRSDNTPIDILITDIQTSGLTGIELINELNCMNIKIPVLIITESGLKRFVIEFISGNDGDEEFIKHLPAILKNDYE